MGHHAKVMHSIHGRMRIKIPSAKGKPDLLYDLKRSVGALPGVRTVAVQPATGGLTVEYNGYTREDFHDVLQEHGTSTGLFNLAPPELSEVDQLAANIEREAEFLATRSELAKDIVSASKRLNLALRKATNNNVDLKVLLPLALAVYTVLEYGAEASTPLWVTLGIFSFNSFVALHPPLPQTPIIKEQVQTAPEALTR